MQESSSLFPATEAWKQTVDILNGELPEKKLAPIAEAAAQAALGDQPLNYDGEADPVVKISFSAILFSLRQLVYFSVPSTAAEAEKALSEPVTVGKSSVALKPPVVHAIAAQWAANGKQLSQNARTDSVRALCRRPAGENAFLAVFAEIEMSKGALLEDDTAKDGLEYNADVTLHAPKSRISLPPTPHHPTGAQLCLSKQQTYDLFSEVDRIQRAIDILLGHAPSA